MTVAEGTGASAPAPLHSGPTRRELHERRLRRRSTTIAAASTALVVLALVVLVPLTPGWERVQRLFFDGTRLREDLPLLLRAFWLDVKIFLWSAPSILVLGMLIALARNVRNPALFPVRLFATIYTDVFRGIPIILTITLIGFGIPGLGLDRPWNSPLLWGSIALILAYSAYVAEVFRAGIESVHESQRAAARSLGLSNALTLRHVVLPQAVRRVVPPLMNDLVSLQKDVALISILGPIEVLRRAGILKAKFANFTPYVGAALIFLCVTIPLTRLTDHMIQRQRSRTTGTAVR